MGLPHMETLYTAGVWKIRDLYPDVEYIAQEQCYCSTIGATQRLEIAKSSGNCNLAKNINPDINPVPNPSHNKKC